MSNNNPPLTEWEYALLGQDPPPEAVAAADARRAEQEAERARKRAEQAEAWPMLHEIKDGGLAQPGQPVNLHEVWASLDDVRWDTRGLPLVEILAERAGGLANRLLAGCRSLVARRDGNTHVYVNIKDDDVIQVVAWSLGGCWRPDRAWHLRTTWDVASDEWGEIRLRPRWGAEFAVRGRNGATLFFDDENGTLHEIAARWYLAWEGRRAVRARLGISQPDIAESPLSQADFLSQP
jgi:hypothetical protein